MTEELQSLLERIQREGIDKAEQEAERILTEARQQAAALVRESETQATERLRKAEQDAARFAEQGRTALRQAARDILLSLGEAIRATLERLIRREVSQAMNPDLLRATLGRLIDAYFRDPANAAPVELTLSEEDRATLGDYFLSRLTVEARDKLEIRADRGIVSGFRVALRDNAVEHDWTDASVADALAQLVQPAISAAVREAIESLPPQRPE
ncbi:MAG: hypothetical protein EHM68_16325 [Lysobacterales bacterium]|nr:MAG: hypothetical protein EHM68_16325 [Xanthomonadales bacterium]